MKKLPKITESFLIKRIKRLIKEEEVEEVRITPQQYYDLLKAVYYKAQAIPRLSRFKGKKIVVVGDLDLSKFRGQKFLTDLGPIKVLGNIDISYTGIKSLDDVEITGHSRYWQTPYEGIMRRRVQKAKEDEQGRKRENNYWDDLNDIDEEGEKAHAAFEYAVNDGDLKTLTDDDKERVEEIKREIEELEEQQNNLDASEESYDDEWSAIENRIDDLNEEKDILLEDKVDVYDLYPNGTHYSMTSFESLSTGHEYAVGTIDEADESVGDYYDDILDRPTEYFSKDYLSYFIDEEEVKDQFRDMVEEWIRDSPESYGVDKELSRDQKEEIWLLEMEKYILENTGVRFPILYPTKKDGTFDFMDEEDNHFQYKEEGNNWFLYKDGAVVSPHQIYDDEDTQDHQDDRDSRISDIEYEIQEIKDNPDGDPDEDSINDAVETYLEDEIGDDPYGWLTGHGYDIDNFIDVRRMKEQLINDADYGEVLNSYNGNYDEIKVNNTYYIVMRTN